VDKALRELTLDWMDASGTVSVWRTAQPGGHVLELRGALHLGLPQSSAPAAATRGQLPGTIKPG
jgi:hypothetical protein